MDPQIERSVMCAACEVAVVPGWTNRGICPRCEIQALLDDGEAEMALLVCQDASLPLLETIQLWEAGALVPTRLTDPWVDRAWARAQALADDLAMAA